VQFVLRQRAGGAIAQSRLEIVHGAKNGHEIRSFRGALRGFGKQTLQFFGAFSQKGRSRFGDGGDLAAFSVGGDGDKATILQPIQGRIDNTRRRCVLTVEMVVDSADEFITVAGLIADQPEQYEPQAAMPETATATSTLATPTGPALTKRAATALFGPAAMMTTASPGSKGKVPHDSDTFLSGHKSGSR
jgi:hypothetical protein